MTNHNNAIGEIPEARAGHLHLESREVAWQAPSRGFGLGHFGCRQRGECYILVSSVLAGFVGIPVNRFSSAALASGDPLL